MIQTHRIQLRRYELERAVAEACGGLGARRSSRRSYGGDRITQVLELP